MKRSYPMGIGASAAIAFAFLSITSATCLLKSSVQPNDSSSIEISRSQMVDPETGSIIFVSSLKRN